MRHERIEINPAIMDGKPVIRGTRVPVERVRSTRGSRRTTFVLRRPLRPTMW